VRLFASLTPPGTFEASPPEDWNSGFMLLPPLRAHTEVLGVRRVSGVAHAAVREHAKCFRVTVQDELEFVMDAFKRSGVGAQICAECCSSGAA
jgi:hypothetical protein